ncbi:MAG TPA: class D sortase [Anaerolineales bacterium]|nr:class D sortase [Anaerolineales bacterium]
MPSKDPRRVDQLSIAELEEALRIRKHEAREERLRQYRESGRASQAELYPETPIPSTAIARPISRRKQWTNGFLLLVEVLAVFGLIFLGYRLFENWRSLNSEASALQASQAQITPEQGNTLTAEATAVIGAVVLPGGHTPPNNPGGAQFNLAEIPEHLRPLVENNPVMQLPTPTAAPQHALRIVIPSINVDAPIVQGSDWEAMRMGVGQVLGTANPGENGNMVLSAHNDIFGEIFRELDRLQPGDTFTVHTRKEIYTYRITGTQVVEPTAVHVMASTINATATLISCYPYLVDTQRIVVFAELVSAP